METECASAASERLANTPAIARKSYIHPSVIALSENAEAIPEDPPDVGGLRIDERRLLSILQR